jgi:type IV pilus biogenesis protein PilP
VPQAAAPVVGAASSFDPLVDPVWQERVRALNRRIDDLNLRIAEEAQELLYLNARNARLQAENQMAAQQRATTTETNTQAIANLPMIRRIEGFRGRRTATLVLDGAALVVQPGDRVPGGWTIKAIEAQAVILEGNNSEVRLRFGTTPPPPPNRSNSTASGSQNAPGTPSILGGVPTTNQRPAMPATIPLGMPPTMPR